MTAHRALNIALTLGLAVALAAILGSSHLLDDHSSEWPASAALQDAQRAARAEYRRDLAASRLCAEANGPGAAWRWTDSGDLVCTDHRTGRAAVVVARKGGAL
jgi:hypothetical protein